MAVIDGAAEASPPSSRAPLGRSTSAARSESAPRAHGDAGFRPDVEGLRAVALGLVLLFHAGVPGTGGAYVGVDAFFVISGFLITGLLVREVEQTGGVRLAAFWARRARRILPSAMAVLLVVLALAALVLPAHERRGVAADVVAAALQAENWWLLSFGTGEMAAQVANTPVNHYWSLAVEEQFYLVWPLLVVAVAAVVTRRGRRRAESRQVRAALAVVLAVVAAVSLAASVLVTSRAELLGYLGTGTRAWQFALGGLLAVLGPALARRCAGDARRRAVHVAGWVGLAVLVTAGAWVAAFPYPGSVAVVPTVAAVAVIASGSLAPVGAGARAGRGPWGSVGSLLAHPVLRACGRLSYVWYLWHVPAVFLAAEVFGASRWPTLLAVELLAALPALATSLLVERPLRFSPRFSATPRRGLLLGLAVTGLTVVAGLALA